jgi:hypothetical protein
MSTHHLFSPSSAHRWMVCAASVEASKGYERTTSADAAEGTVAHHMASTCLELGLDAHEVWQAVETASEDGHTIEITAEMRGHVQSYLDYVRALGGALQVEQKMTFSAEPDFGGTADALVWDLEGRRLHVVDFKYGKGIRVHAERNKQMLCYAVLALSQAGDMVEIDDVVLHVHQPRIENVSSWTTPVASLVHFANEIASAIARARMQGRALAKGHPFDHLDFVPGEHCKFCPHSAKCKALKDQAVLSAQQVFADVSEVDTETLGQILAKADMIDAWIGAVRKEAMDRALRGEVVDGYKLVRKRATRQWVDEKRVIDIAVDNMIDVWEPRTLMTPPALERAVGNKKLFASIFGGVIESVSSGLTLAAADDKREAVDPKTAAAEKAIAVFTAVE